VGRQVNYRSHPADIADLERYLISAGGVVVGQPSETAEPVIYDSLDVDHMLPPARRNRSLIARPDDLPQCRWRHHPQGWLIDKLDSPVVEYSPGYDASGVARRGRMWFATTYLRDDEIVAADDDFVRWADRILRWVRRHWTRCDSFIYESPTVARFRGVP
jgi:hypothetical protein